MFNYTYKLISNANTAVTGNLVDLGETFRSFTMSCNITDPDGGVSAVSVAFEFTQDGTVWYTVVNKRFTAAQLSDLRAAWNIIDKPARAIRAKITNLVGATANTSIDVLVERCRDA